MPWNLFLILPNLNLPPATPFAAEFICICSGMDARLDDLEDNPGNVTARQMVKAFRNWFGIAYTPSCLLVRTDAPQVLRDAEAIRSFRNVCALSTTTNATARLISGGQWLPLYSDFFLFAGHVPAKNGWIQNVDAIVQGMNDDVLNFRGQCAGQIDSPAGFAITRDPEVFRRLLKAWDSHYVRVPTDPDLRALFRSLEVAFQANRFPSDGLSSINDVGTRIGLWVSAFEVLFHPGPSKSVNKRVVQDAIERIAFSDARLRRTNYKIVYGRNSTVFRVTFAAYLYDELYRARNAFLHGNPVTRRDLRVRRQRNGKMLAAIAPVLYNVGLRAYTKSMFSMSQEEELADFLFGEGEIRDALLTIRGPQDG
jgi:hypothetical protein